MTQRNSYPIDHLMDGPGITSWVRVLSDWSALKHFNDKSKDLHFGDMGFNISSGDAEFIPCDDKVMGKR